MARKKKLIHIEHRPNFTKVYTDLSDRELEEIKGVSAASQLCGFFEIHFDPRYDQQEVLEDIRRAACEKAYGEGHCPCCCGCVTSV